MSTSLELIICVIITLIIISSISLTSVISSSSEEEQLLEVEHDKDPYRTAYHFQLPANWMNDPNGGHKGEKEGYQIPAGTDIFVSVYNLHRSPYFWDKPHEFEPERFLVKRETEVEGWSGYDPSRSPGALYPNEIVSDFAFLPFGGGPRKCVGDQFALMESTIALAMFLQKFVVELRGSPDEVELVTGATIHTKSELWCKLRKRADVPVIPIFEIPQTAIIFVFWLK